MEFSLCIPLILCTVLCVVCTGQEKGETRKEAPPVLNFHNPYLVVNNNSTLTLSCEGTKPLMWNSTVDIRFDDRVLLHELRINKPNNYAYKSSLTVTGILYTDTGIFSCLYNVSQDSDDVIYEEPSSTASVYVYVRDPENLFVPVGSFGDFHFQAVVDGKKSIIPCRPTQPTVNVTLNKYPDTQVQLKQGDVEFDPMVGFILKYPNLFYNSIFDCQARLNGKIQTMNLHLIWKDRKDKPPVPDIEKDLIRMNLHKNEFSLTCVVNKDLDEMNSGTDKANKVNEHLTISWSYPNQQNQHIQVLPTTSSKIVSPNGYSFIRMESKLVATKATKADGGRYSCHVTNDNSKVESAEVFVPIENSARIIYTNLDNSERKIEIGDQMKLSCYVNGYPRPSIRWYKDGRQIIPMQSSKFEFMEQDMQLFIEEVDFSDSGFYTCRTTNRLGSSSKNISIVIYEPSYLEENPDIYEATASPTKKKPSYALRETPPNSNGSQVTACGLSLLLAIIFVTNISVS